MNNSQTFKQLMEIPDEIRSFLLHLLQEANIVPLNDSLRDEMVQGLYQELDRYIATKLIENIPLEQLETFLHMQAEQKPKEEVEAFLLKHIPEIEQLYVDSFNEFRAMYLEGVAKARAAQN